MLMEVIWGLLSPCSAKTYKPTHPNPSRNLEPRLEVLETPSLNENFKIPVHLAPDSPVEKQVKPQSPADGWLCLWSSDVLWGDTLWLRVWRSSV